MQEADRLPFLTAPHDALRQGLTTLKDGAAASHPVEQIQKLSGPAGERARAEMLTNLYGAALPARMQLEKQILDRRAARRRWAGGGVVRCCARLLQCTAWQLPATLTHVPAPFPPSQARAAAGPAVVQAGAGGDDWRAG